MAEHTIHTYEQVNATTWLCLVCTDITHVEPAVWVRPLDKVEPLPKADDICVWCNKPWGDERCYNGKDICVDCCVAAGDPCGHE